MVRYAVDLDGVVFDSNRAMLGAINERFGTDYQLADMRAWEWSAWCPDEHTQHAWITFSDLVAQGLPLLPGAVEGLQRLMAAGGAAIITHRTPNLIAATATATAGLPCQIVHHVDQQADKAAKAIELGCQVALEDNPHQAAAYAQAGLRVYLFSYPYNAYVRLPRVIPVAGWQEVLAWEGL